MDKQQEPRLRFQGFTGAWEEKVLGEVTEYLSDGTHFSPKSQNGEYKYITSKNIRNSGLDLSDVSYISAEEHQEIYKRCSVKFGDLLLTKDGASTGNCCINFLDEEFSLLSSVAVLRPKQKKHNANFLCQVLQSPIGQNEIKGSMAGQAITRITLEKLRAYKFNFPLYEEQTHLGLFFRRLDSQIAESRAVLEKSRQLKKAMLEKMFPANGEKMPKIRFKGFEGEWEEKNFESVGEFNPKTEIPSIFQYVDLESVVGTQLISYREESKETAPSRAQRLAKNGDLFFQAVRPYQKNNYLFEKNNENFVFSTGYIQIRPQNDGYFLLTLVQKEEFVQEVLLRCTGTSYPAINASSLQDIAILTPQTSKEQIAIGNFFRQLDETIALQSAEVEKLNQLKKGLLAAMLV